jgi:hypothetical protein
VAGAVIFGLEPAVSSARRFEPNHSAALDVTRLAATLPASRQARLERLRGFGESFRRAITCSCWRAAAEEGAGIFVVAAEAVGPALTLREQVIRRSPLLPSRCWSSRPTPRRPRKRSLRR